VSELISKQQKHENRHHLIEQLINFSMSK